MSIIEENVLVTNEYSDVTINRNTCEIKKLYKKGEVASFNILFTMNSDGTCWNKETRLHEVVGDSRRGRDLIPSDIKGFYVNLHSKTPSLFKLYKNTFGHKFTGSFNFFHKEFTETYIAYKITYLNGVIIELQKL